MYHAVFYNPVPIAAAKVFVVLITKKTAWLITIINQIQDNENSNERSWVTNRAIRMECLILFVSIAEHYKIKVGAYKKKLYSIQLKSNSINVIKMSIFYLNINKRLPLK